MKTLSNLTAWCLTVIASKDFGVQSDFVPIAELSLKNGGVLYPALAGELESEAVRIHNLIASRGQKGVNEANVILSVYLNRAEEVKTLLQRGFTSVLNSHLLTFHKQESPCVNFPGSFEYTTVVTLNTDTFSIRIATLDANGGAGTLGLKDNTPIERFNDTLVYANGMILKNKGGKS